jgi:hypothetical protein
MSITASVRPNTLGFSAVQNLLGSLHMKAPMLPSELKKNLYIAITNAFALPNSASKVSDEVSSN